MPQYMLTLIHSVILVPRTGRAFFPGDLSNLEGSRECIGSIPGTRRGLERSNQSGRSRAVKSSGSGVFCRDRPFRLGPVLLFIYDAAV